MNIIYLKNASEKYVINLPLCLNNQLYLFIGSCIWYCMIYSNECFIYKNLVHSGKALKINDAFHIMQSLFIFK